MTPLSPIEQITELSERVDKLEQALRQLLAALEKPGTGNELPSTAAMARMTLGT